MTQKIARYSVTNGLAGCYMPDSANGPYSFATRKELADFIRGEIEMLDWPASIFADVKIKRLWSFIQRNGSSVAHFRLQRGNYELAFHGLTEDEARQMEAENDF